MNKRRKLIIVGQTPPPHNGQAIMIRHMIDGLRDDFDLLHIRMAYSDSVVTAGKFKFSKIVHLFRLVRETRRVLKRHPGAVLYYPPASPKRIPILRDIIFLYAVRPLVGKIVFHFHVGGLSEFLRCHAGWKWMAMKAYGSPDMVVELGKSCPRDGEFFGARQVRIVPNGTDVPLMAEPRTPEAGILRILYVGIHTEAKGLFDLLATAKELKRRNVGFKIRTAGAWYTETERLQFEELRNRYGLQNEVQTLGQKIGKDLWSLYVWADVFFFPTHWEAFGIVQLEAMAYGLPVVASRLQGPKDVIVDGKTGILCPAHDTVAFADGLQRLAQNDILRVQMGHDGQKRYRENFTTKSFIREMKKVMDEVCS